MALLASAQRHYEIAPSSVSCADSFPPRGSLRDVWGYYCGIFLRQRAGFAKCLPLGGKVGRRSRVG